MVFKKYPKLFKTTHTGAKIFWHIRIFEDDQGQFKLITERGHVDGKIQTDIVPIIPKAKRTGEEQAVLEADQRYKKKIRENYRPLTDDGKEDKDLFIKPYLLKQYYKFSDKLNFPVSIQPKLDGIRSLFGAFNSKKTKGKLELRFISRRCVQYPNPLTHLKHDYMKSGLPKKKKLYFDGELYIHDPDVYEVDIGGNLRREPPYSTEQQNFTNRIQYWIFDYVDISQPKLTFAQRRKNLEQWFKNEPKPKSIFLVPQQIVNNHQQIDQQTKKYIEEGYEGAVVRNLNFTYDIKGPRICDALKVKTSFDEEYKIIGAEKDKYGQVIWILEYYDPQGKPGTFKSTHAGTLDKPVTREQRQQLYKDHKKYLGWLATVRYQDKTNTGKPKFGRVIKIKQRMS
jgi:ATP-dependent DNA ligase